MASLFAGPIPAVAGPQTIAVNLDDTLNNFTTTLQHDDFAYNSTDWLSKSTFEHYLRKIRNGDSDSSGHFSTAYSFCRFKIHTQCWQRARALPDGVEFMQWLQRNRWRIIIFAQRDLRQTQDCTRTWLQKNDIPFDHLFTASNKIVFCNAWGIRHLIDCASTGVSHGERHETKICYSITPGHPCFSALDVRSFRAFAEVKAWIQK